METDHLCIGGGPAGVFAALTAAEHGKRCIILEHNKQLGRKLRITGKGRCNLTNNCDRDTLMANIPANGKFLYSAFSRCTPQDVMAYFEKLGVPLKTERGNRVFPVSDRAEDIVQALQKAVRLAGIPVVHGDAAELLLENGRCTGIRTADGREYRAGTTLLATGGMSYPKTGSDGSGYRLAETAGHTIVPPMPSLIPLVTQETWCQEAMGLSLRNVILRLYRGNKCIFEELGEMLFTHFGISGPLTLSASSHLGDMKKHKYHAEIDLKPALSEEQLYDRITRDFALLANHAAQGALVKLLPSSMQPVMVARWGIDPATKANQITREQKRELVQLIKHWRVSIDARGDLAHAVITSGGVSVREVDPKTMQSKKALGLYFAGEVLDVDAYTGGYNLQIAFCTAQSFANHL